MKTPALLHHFSESQAGELCENHEVKSFGTTCLKDSYASMRRVQYVVMYRQVPSAGVQVHNSADHPFEVKVTVLASLCKCGVPQRFFTVTRGDVDIWG